MPRRSYGEVFTAAGRWWEMGRLSARAIAGPDDATPLFRGHAKDCPLCRENQDHSTAAHRQARRDDLRKAVCCPDRAYLIHFP